MPQPTTLEIEFGGRTLTMETGKLAGLAGGAVTVRYGDTLVLGTANRSEPRPGLDFFPLTVDFEERMYAAGKIPGGFIKREGRASEAATLAARLTDRPIRPLFPAGYKDDVQIVITVLSTDQENDPDVLGTIAGSAALTISEIPFQGPIAAVRVGRIDGEFVLNPTTTQLAESELDLVVSGTRDAIMMVEAGVKILPEDVMAEAILFGHRSLGPVIDLQDKLREAVGKPKRIPYLEPLTDSVLRFADQAKAGEFVIIDVETTGTDPKMADLVEVAAVRVKGGKITDRWSTLVNPGRPIVGNQMHGITDKDVKGAPSPAEAARKALDFAGDAPIVGHSVGFDIAFLEEALGDGTRIEQGRYLDTLVIAREGYPDLENYKLGTLAAFFGIDLTANHRALPDAEATANLLIWFGNDLPGRIETLKGAIADSIRATRKDKDEAATLLEAARRNARVSKSLFGLVHRKTVRQLVLADGLRMDGRATDEIRPISVEVGLLPRAHGSGLFTRGQTQALTVATLGASSDVQRIDTISPETEKRYLHHYNFPPYSTGENKPMRGPSRRDIGHGNLAARALLPVLPSHDEFPYVIRLVSEVVSGNGSTSMASTCGSTLALMDAGVPISAPVAGAAMGLVLDEATGNFVVLTDILGKEDSIGDMDFKVTGTADGITALQMDIKVKGIDERVIREGLKQALAARLFILDKMTAVLPAAREEMSDFAPRIITIKINPEKIREIIGKGGSMIRKIQEETSTEINVEDDGTVEIAAVSGENSRKAIQWIESLTREVEVGALYLGKVTRLMTFGAFVEILPGKEGLVRIGELADYHVPSVEDVVSVGDEVMVVVTEIDRQGRVNLSRKAAMQRHLAK
ncbi:MAG: polyribonucleotide nucleotidyltransferase [Chloroflexota bacterium]